MHATHQVWGGYESFGSHPFADDTKLSDVPAVSNVRQDLTEWQEKHASLVLSTVKVASFFNVFLWIRKNVIKAMQGMGTFIGVN